MEPVAAARPVRAVSTARTAAQSDSLAIRTAAPDPPANRDPQTPPDSNAADGDGEDFATLGARLADIEARVGKAAGDTIGDPGLAQAQADFDRETAWRAEYLRETNVLVALFTEQRKHEDELLTKRIEMIA